MGWTHRLQKNVFDSVAEASGDIKRNKLLAVETDEERTEQAVRRGAAAQWRSGKLPPEVQQDLPVYVHGFTGRGHGTREDFELAQRRLETTLKLRAVDQRDSHAADR